MVLASRTKLYDPFNDMDAGRWVAIDDTPANAVFVRGKIRSVPSE